MAEDKNDVQCTPDAWDGLGDSAPIEKKGVVRGVELKKVEKTTK